MRKSSRKGVQVRGGLEVASSNQPVLGSLEARV